MADPTIPATVIGSWSFPGWYEKFTADVKDTGVRSARPTATRPSAMPRVWPSTTSSAPASTGSPTARCNASISTGVLPVSAGGWSWLQGTPAVGRPRARRSTRPLPGDTALSLRPIKLATGGRISPVLREFTDRPYQGAGARVHSRCSGAWDGGPV